MNDLMKFIDVRPIYEKAKELNCPFIGIIGGKGTGKTYGCVKLAIEDFFTDNSERPFFYVRRYDKTFTRNICGNLVGSHRQEIINYSKGKYNTAELYGKIFELMRKTTTEKGIDERKNRKTIAYCRSLNNVESETGDDKGDISCIIYDEFLTRGAELKDEFLKLQTLHNNATRNRTDRFIPMFLLGNTVSKDSAVAEQFGIRMRDIKRGLNVFENKAHKARIVLYYTDETAMNVEAARTYYDRFENSRINMITRGDWVLGSYKTAPLDMMYTKGFTAKMYYNRIAVNVTLGFYGQNPFILVRKPSEKYDIAISPYCGKSNIQLIPKIFIRCVLLGNLYVENSDIGEDFRDICKHIANGKEIVNAIG